MTLFLSACLEKTIKLFFCLKQHHVTLSDIGVLCGCSVQQENTRPGCELQASSQQYPGLLARAELFPEAGGSCSFSQIEEYR